VHAIQNKIKRSNWPNDEVDDVDGEQLDANNEWVVTGCEGAPTKRPS